MGDEQALQVGSKAWPFEPGQLSIRRLPQKDRRGEVAFAHLMVLSELIHLGSALSSQDKIILDAILTFGSPTAAARAIAPERYRSYRTYISKRIEFFEGILRKVTQESVLATIIGEVKLRELGKQNSSEDWTLEAESRPVPGR